MELMLIHHLNDSKFLIRLPKDNFRKERKQMKTSDEIVSINLITIENKISKTNN